MTLNIKVQAFEGPLDLLLHLIKTSEVDIYNIPIAQITEQYIEYLKAMEELDLNIASEFILMAATLLEIKSNMLLPKVKKEDETSADEDPRKELVEKLIEYKKYKEMSLKLKDMEEDNYIYFKTPEIIDDIDNREEFFENITLENLMFAFKRVVDSYENRFNKLGKIPENISYDEYKIEDKMDEIRQALKSNVKIKFEDFFNKAEGKMEIVVIFLAMLELIKLKFINVIQRENFGDIVIERQEDQWRIS